MLAAGAAWGVYSLRGKGVDDPTRVTAGNFLRAVPFAATVSALMHSCTKLDNTGVAYAVASGAVTSGFGYAIWYSVLPSLKVTTAAAAQLSVPVLASAGILGGIGLVIRAKQTAIAAQ